MPFSRWADERALLRPRQAPAGCQIKPARVGLDVVPGTARRSGAAGRRAPARRRAGAARGRRQVGGISRPRLISCTSLARDAASGAAARRARSGGRRRGRQAASTTASSSMPAPRPGRRRAASRGVAQQAARLAVQRSSGERVVERPAFGLARRMHQLQHAFVPAFGKAAAMSAMPRRRRSRIGRHSSRRHDGDHVDQPAGRDRVVHARPGPSHKRSPGARIGGRPPRAPGSGRHRPEIAPWPPAPRRRAHHRVDAVGADHQVRARLGDAGGRRAAKSSSTPPRPGAARCSGGRRSRCRRAGLQQHRQWSARCAT